MLCIGRIVDQKQLPDFEGRYLIADYFFYTGNCCVDNLPDLLHPFLYAGGECSVILVDGFEICFSHDDTYEMTITYN